MSSSPTVRVDPYRAFNFLITLTRSAKSLNFGGMMIPSPPSMAPPPPPPSTGGGAAPSPAPRRAAPKPPAPAAGFSECTGLELALDIEEYKEGGNNGTVLRFPTRAKWTNLRLKRGIALSDDLWQWHYGFVQGTGARRDGVVTLLDEQQNPVKVWLFKRGIPVKWTGPSLNATQSQVAFEEIEIAHEGMTLL
jgi:phage tail-like protein